MKPLVLQGPLFKGVKRMDFADNVMLIGGAERYSNNG